MESEMEDDAVKQGASENFFSAISADFLRVLCGLRFWPDTTDNRRGR